MAFLRCDNCNHFEPISEAKYKMMGLGVSAFGVFGWFSYLFAGSGHAFLIASAIVIGGFFCFKASKEIGVSMLSDKRCPKCHEVDWDKTPYDKILSPEELKKTK